MTAVIEYPPLPAIPLEVVDFAVAEEVAWYLRPVLTMTRNIFPTASLTLRLGDDPEIADDRHIVIEVDATNLEVPQMVAGQRQWSEGVFAVCPATQAHLFRLSVV